MLRDPNARQYADNIVLMLGVSGRIDAVGSLKDFLEDGDAAETVDVRTYKAKSDVPVALGCILNQIDIDIEKTSRGSTGDLGSTVNSVPLQSLKSAREGLFRYLSTGMLDPEEWQARARWKSPLHSEGFDRDVDLIEQTMLGLGLSGDKDALCLLNWTKDHLRDIKGAGLVADRCGFSPESPHRWGSERLKPAEIARLQRLLNQTTSVNRSIANSATRGLAEFYLNSLQ
jgi:hypothetical protein